MHKATLNDLQLIASCHQKAFPDSVTTLLGTEFISEMFKWYLQAENRFMYCIIENENCIGYFGGYVVTGAEYSGSGTGMAQAGFYAAIKSILKNPLLLFHPEITKRYSFIFKNIFYRIQYIFDKKKVECPPENNSDLKARLVVIGVDPISQRKGNGSLLIKKFEEVCREKNVKSFGLSVRPENKNAIHSYELNGWEIIGSDHVSLKMEKQLE